MYDWEIGRKMEEHNYNIDANTYKLICDTSPQISQVLYNAYEDIFQINTMEGGSWRFKVYPA